MNLACIFSALLVIAAPASEAAELFDDVMEDEVGEAAKFHFARNPRFDDEGFNLISFDEDWPITELFLQQYGRSASTKSFAAAFLDFEHFEVANVTFNNVYQLIIVGEHQDARKAMAAFSFNLVSHLIGENMLIENVEQAKQAIRQVFQSLYSLVGNDNFASFLNLKLGSSLSFVMDTTGSMGGEIEAAKARVVDIVNQTAGTNSAPLNYVLVPYNDPGYGPVTKTSDSIEFIAAVNALRANGGGDFPELAMVGILLAAQNSNFRSILYVFTDADAKLTKLQNHVIALCLIKKISVNVFLTQDIARRKKRALLTGRSLYDNVAELTGGSVILVGKAYIEDATEIMKASTVQGLVTLASETHTNASRISIDVDSSVESLTVQLTGTFDYQGYDSDAESNATMTTLADIPNVKLFTLEGVTAGRYTFNFVPNELDDYAVLVTGRSGLGFHATLSQKKRGTDTFVASRQLLAGAETRAEMTVYGDAANVVFENFQLISHTGHVLFQSPLTKVSDTKYERDGVFNLPREPMFARLTGFYDEKPIVRIDPCAITPTVSLAYFEEIADVTVIAGTSLQLTTVLHNAGTIDSFIVQVTDIHLFATIDGASTVYSSIVDGGNFNEILEFSLNNDGTQTVTLNINVPAGTEVGILSKVLLTATGVTDNTFVFTTFVVSVEDTVTRCPTPTTPIGGELRCTPDVRSVGSACELLCGEEYGLEGQGSMTCQSDGTWSPETPGKCRLLGSQTCYLAGDPHYTTFDGFYYDFMGSCLYTLVQTHGEAGVEPVTIQTENDLFYGTESVSWFKQAFVTAYNITVHFKRGKVVLVDGIKVELPVILNGGNLQIKLDGADVLLTTTFKMEVRFNGNHYFRVTLPGRYINQVSGLCGNYDGDAANDLMIGNETFAASQFGNAMEIVGGSRPWCRKGQPGDDETGCENEAVEALYAERCGAILSDCFSDCVDNQTAKSAFLGCLFDMCRTGGNDKTAEDAISDFATACSERGFQICNWRERFDFPIPVCEANAHYEFQANRCPNTCVNPTASDRCESKTRTEACVCNGGFLRDGTDCVRESDCGCASQGRYHKRGDNYLQSSCTERCECQNGVISCSPFSCEEGEECRVLGTGQLGCALQQVDQFSATGDPHYTTLDGSRYDFMGTCRYIMLRTNSDKITDSDRLITISAQNENRHGNTRVSYVRAVYLEIGQYEIQLGPETAIEVMRNGTVLDVELPFHTDGQLFSAQIIGRFARVTTRFGIKAQFDGTNLYVDVPSFYMNRVSGLGSANYTGSSDDDFGGKSIEDFVADFIYGDGCEEEDREPFVCGDEDRAKWGGPEYCGKITSEEGPFQYCIGEVDATGAFENCVFDACATEGDEDVINKAIQAFAEECRFIDGPLPCDWENQLGITFECPENSRYDGCASVCTDTCRNPRAVDRCQSDETVGKCVCDLGYVKNDGKCVKQTTCGCVFEDGTYHEQGDVVLEPECAFSTTCAGAQVVVINDNPCGEFATCQGEDGEFECIPNELPYALIYGTINFRTFDDKHFTFRGNCGYLVVRYSANEDMPLLPTWNVYVRNGEDSYGMTQIEEVVVEVLMTPELKHTVTINRNKEVMVNGIAARFGAKLELVEIHYQRGDAVLDFKFGLHVRFNGDDWARIDVDHQYEGRLSGLAGNFNGDPEDDFLEGDIMRTEQQWGDFWRQSRFSADECSITTDGTDMPCPLQRRFEGACDCGALTALDGPFSVCHDKVDPEPFMQSCVRNACLRDGSVTSIANVLKAYYRACIGKGVFIENWRDTVAIPMECPMYSHYDNCTNDCQPTCGDEEARCLTLVCQEGCICDDGYILSNGKCVEMEKCGCMAENGYYYEHGDCVTTMNCTRKCTCVYGEWNCEEQECNDMQSCRVMHGELGCFWKDPCKYDNGGCSDICGHDDDYKRTCSCRSRRILSSDNVTCIDISSEFFDRSGDSCGTTFNVWKAEFQTWQNNYLPEWTKELEAYRKLVASGIVSNDLDVCRYQWTEWYDNDDPEGCGDEETLDLLRVKYPDICEKPIWAQGRLADGRTVGSAMASFQVDENGLVCKNADQEKGTSCPDFSVRFLCRVEVQTEVTTCG